MTLFDRFLHWLLPKFFEYRDIVIDGKLYLRRYFLKGRGTSKQWFLHHILLPDAGRDLHDHPWSFTTWILRGGYIELVDRLDRSGNFHVQKIRILERWTRTFNGAWHTHQILNVFPSTWTLVNAGPAWRIWGFFDPLTENWTPWRTYLGLSLDTPDLPEDALPFIDISTKKFAEGK